MTPRKTFILSMLVIVVLLTCFMLLRQEPGVVVTPEYKCPDSIECLTVKPGEPLKIAVLQPLSGRLVESGTEQINVIKLALSLRADLFPGHPVELQIEDSQCTPEGGAVAALKVTADPQIAAIIGTNCSGAATQASKIMSEAGLVMISGTNSAASLTSIDGNRGADWYPGYFRTMFNSVKRGEAGAIFAYRELGLTRAATLNDGDKRSVELTNFFEKTFSELGGEIVLSTTVYRKDTDMKPVLNRVADSGAQIIFYPIFPPESIYITQQARDVSGLQNTAMMISGSTARNDDFIKAVGETGKGMYFVDTFRVTGMAFDQLKTNYIEKYGRPAKDSTYTFTFDATNILLNALESVAVQDQDGTLYIGRQALRDAMYATADYKGVTGTLTSDKFGDCGTPVFNIVRLTDPAAGLKGLLENEVFLYTPKK